ncbi:ROK family protein [Aurantibacter sp.]|uniref:ROK family protein n=1 Tax=Aurantibacter sp. TaxID=2807103 RepID=UPI003265F054
MDKNPQNLVFAIDIGGTYTKIGLVNQEGDVLDSRKFNTDAKQPYSQFIKKLSDEIQILVTPFKKKYTIHAIGIGAPNASYISGKMISPPNFRWGESVIIKDNIQNLLKLPAYITNDANAAALGELYYGAGKAMTNFIVLTLGTGLGSGIINESKLIYGQYGMAGELGHVNVYPEGRQCNCGLKGCLETYASVTGIKRTVFELLSDNNSDSLLRSYSYDQLDGKTISEAAHKGDELALKAFDKTAKILGRKMADSVAHLEPEAFILSGGLSHAGDLFIQPLKNYMEAALFKAYKNKVKIILSKATSSDSILGPAALAW